MENLKVKVSSLGGYGPCFWLCTLPLLPTPPHPPIAHIIRQMVMSIQAVASDMGSGGVWWVGDASITICHNNIASFGFWWFNLYILCLSQLVRSEEEHRRLGSWVVLIYPIHPILECTHWVLQLQQYQNSTHIFMTCWVLTFLCSLQQELLKFCCATKRPLTSIFLQDLALSKVLHLSNYIYTSFTCQSIPRRPCLW